MSKKLPPNRLNQLFADLEQNSSLSPLASNTHSAKPGWTWETDLQGCFTSCSADVSDGLGFSADTWLGKSLFTFQMSPSTQNELRLSIEKGQFPIESTGEFFHTSGKTIPVRMNIYVRRDAQGRPAGWRGFNQVLCIPDPAPSPPSPGEKSHAANGNNPIVKKSTGPLVLPDHRVGVGTHIGSVQTTLTPWTKAARQGMNFSQPVTETDPITQNSALAVPFVVNDQTQGVVELLDESGARIWSEDDRLLVQEVSRQLALALENAHLYAKVQQELAERTRAEKEILTRNQELSLLNQVGQQLSKLTSRQELLNLVQKSIGEIIDHRNMSIVLFDPVKKKLSFPVNTLNGLHQALPDRLLANHIEDHILQKKSPLLLGTQTSQGLQQRGIQVAGLPPKSVIAIPLLAGDRAIGAIVAQDFEHENAYTTVDVELLSTIAAQATTALENSNLFQEISNTLQALEVRERYQGNVAKAVATLTQFGTMALPKVLNQLSIAAHNDRTFFARVSDDAAAPTWLVATEWRNQPTRQLTVSSEPKPVRFSLSPQWMAELREKGWITANIDEISGSSQNFLEIRGSQSCLLLAVPGQAPLPHLLVFEQIHENRVWLNEELNVLRMASDALSNTIARENLLEQLQASFQRTQGALSQTDLLYRINQEIAQANDLDTLIHLVADTMAPSAADRAALFRVLKPSHEEISGYEVVGYVDKKLGPSCLGMVIPAENLTYFASLSDAVMLPDIDTSAMDFASRSTFEAHAVRALFIMPLTSAGETIGYLTVSSRETVEFSGDDTHIIQLASGSFAIAMERIRLLAETQRRALELQTAAEIARDTTSTLDFNRLLARLADLLVERFHFYHAAIYLLDDAGKQAVVRQASGHASQSFTEPPFQVAVGSQSAVGQSVASGMTQTMRFSADPSGGFPHQFLPNSVMEVSIPLKSGDRIFGALDIHYDQEGRFSAGDVSVLQILADQISVAIQNASAYELSQKSYREIKEVDRVKSQFLANMSHELRTPLNSIIGFSRVILKGIDGPVNETQKQDLSAIYNSGQHLLTLINNILDLSKIEAGKMELQIGEVNVADLINSVMSTAVGLVKDKPIRLHHEVSPNLPAVQADLTRVRQILLNFVSNAAKFTENGSITVSAAPALSPDGNPEVMVVIADTGAGIAAEDREKLFLPFSQVDDSPTRKSGGTGLGLSICRSMVEMHGGRIGLLHSEIGHGSTFFFTLPITATTKNLKLN